MAEMKEEMISLDYCTNNVVKIVSKQCPITWTMEKPVLEPFLNNCHYPCPICGSLEKWNGAENHKKMSPVGVDLFKNLVLALKLEASGGGGGGGDSSAIDQEEGVQNFICSECLGKFDMLESLQNEIALLEDKVEEILVQLRKTIRDRCGLISRPSLTVSNIEPASTTTDLPLMSDLDEENEFEATTHNMADADEEIDIKPVILDFQDESNQLPDDDDLGNDDPLGGVDDIFQEHPIKKPEEEGDCANKPTRRCKIRATQVIADILRNDDDNDDDNLNDQYSPNNDSHTDSDNNDELELDTPKKEHYYRRPGIPPHRSTELQNMDKKHICPKCGKQVKHLREHMETHVRRFSCPTCPKTYSTKSDVVRHNEKIHLQKLRYKCEKCGKGFYTHPELKIHVNMRIPCTEVLKKKKFDCPNCTERFSSRANLLRHKKHSSHKLGGMQKNIKCPHSKCKSSFFTETHCQRHFELCHQEEGPSKEISCPICSLRFFTASHLRFHIQSIHTCTFCNKTFLTKTVRDKHKETHTGSHPYICTKCGNTFNQRKVLKVHLKMTSCNPDKDEMDKIREKRWKYKRELRIARNNATDL